MGAEAQSGAQLLLAAPLAWAAVAGLVVCAWRGPRWQVSVGSAAAGALLAWWLPPWPATSALIVASLGAVGAVRWQAPAAFAGLLAAASGVAAGSAADFHWASPLEVAGGVTAMVVVAASFLSAAQWLARSERVQPHLPLAFAVLGGWTVALGTLLSLLAARQG